MNKNFNIQRNKNYKSFSKKLELIQKIVIFWSIFIKLLKICTSVRYYEAL